MDSELEAQLRAEQAAQIGAMRALEAKDASKDIFSMTPEEIQASVQRYRDSQPPILPT